MGMDYDEIEYRRLRRIERQRQQRRRQRRRKRLIRRILFVCFFFGISIFAIIHFIPRKQKEQPQWGVGQGIQQPAAKPNPEQTPIALDWNLTLVNETNPLPDDFTVETETLKNGMAFDKRAISALRQMVEEGNQQGLQLIVCSAYRSVARQKEIFQQEIDESMAQGRTYEEAYEVAKSAVAIPGTSEHNLGLAADICALDHQILDEAFAQTEEGTWLYNNAEKYGFILRYPKDKQEITGIIFEPWHYRYVGVEDAKEMNRLGMCLEEYVEYLKRGD